MNIGNVKITDSTNFLHSFFLRADVSSADKIDRQVEAFVIQSCLDYKLIEEITQNGKRLYHILPEGRKIIYSTQ